MTLNLTLVSHRNVVQVSDRRLCMLAGSRIEVYEDDFNDRDNANKAILARCADAVFGVTYTGLALLGNRTDIWLTRFLSGVISQPLETIVTSLKDYATREISYKLSYVPLEYRGTEFIVAGYRGPSLNYPFSSQVSNIKTDESKNNTILNSFYEEVRTIKLDAPNEFTFIIAGETKACDFQKIMLEIRKTDFFQAGDSERIVNAFVQQIRLASEDSQYGKTIGRNCTSMILKPGSDRAVFGYHGENEPTMMFYPNFVCKEYTIADVQVSTTGWVGPRKGDPKKNPFQ